MTISPAEAIKMVDEIAINAAAKLPPTDLDQLQDYFAAAALPEALRRSISSRHTWRWVLTWFFPGWLIRRGGVSGDPARFNLMDTRGAAHIAYEAAQSMLAERAKRQLKGRS